MRTMPRRLAVLLALSLLGCTGKDVVAKVGDQTLRTSDLQAFTAGRSPRAEGDSLDALVQRALIAEGGRRAGLAKDPAVQARMAAAAREVLAQAELESVVGSATTDAALRQRYQEHQGELARRQVHVAHIMLRVPADASDSVRAAARTRAVTLHARLLGGASFEQLARTESDDTVTGVRGGDLGTIQEGQVDAAFFDAAAALKKGDTSPPVQTPFGFHVLRALEDPKTVTPSFEQARGTLAATARREAEAGLVERLKKDIPVRLYREHLPEGKGH
jgi:peptidyl-prolyl cis-trans isomerase C